MIDKTTWIMLTVVIIVCTTAWLLWPANAGFKPLGVKQHQTFSGEALLYLRQYAFASRHNNKRRLENHSLRA